MSRRTAEANKAISDAWKNEQNLIREGKGTRDWTPEQQEDILQRGKAYDENGKAFEGHHMKSVEKYPEYQGDARNIQFLSRSEHLTAHEGSFRNSTNGYFDPAANKTHSFGENKYEPCSAKNLSEPIINQNHGADKIVNQTEAPRVSSHNLASVGGGGARAPDAQPAGPTAAQINQGRNPQNNENNVPAGPTNIDPQRNASAENNVQGNPVPAGPEKGTNFTDKSSSDAVKNVAENAENLAAQKGAEGVKKASNTMTGGIT